MRQWDSDFLWDLEWFDADGTPCAQKLGLSRDAAQQQVQRWLHEKPESRVYLYRRRGEVCVLTQIYRDLGKGATR